MRRENKFNSFALKRKAGRNNGLKGNFICTMMKRTKWVSSHLGFNILLHFVFVQNVIYFEDLPFEEKEKKNRSRNFREKRKKTVLLRRVQMHVWLNAFNCNPNAQSTITICLSESNTDKLTHTHTFQFHHNSRITEKMKMKKKKKYSFNWINVFLFNWIRLNEFL